MLFLHLLRKSHRNKLLKSAIYAAGMNQKELSLRAHLSEIDISRIIHGRRPASEGEKRRLCRLLKRTNAELFGGQEPGDCL
jgi:transcriptional regulator with XRE-family HTH domain